MTKLTDDAKRFAKLIKETKFAMLTTIVEGGELHSRPMTLVEHEFEGQLWFFTSKNSDLAKQVQAHANVNLAFANIKDNSYVSACGEASILKDSAKEKELWSPLFKAWFPEGLEDPNLCLLKVDVRSADYWESPSATIVQLVGFAKAVVTGKPAGPALGQHGHITIS